MIKTKKTSLLISMLFLAMSFSLYSQKQIHIITKTIKKEFKASDKTLIIIGEKSTITINSWDKDFYQIEIKLISKNPNKSLAEKDLKVMLMKYISLEILNQW